jgi:bla regulator protein blaR1
MAEFVDRLGAALLDASLAATAISGFVVLAMVQCRQPARRRGWARVGLISALALFPMAALNPFPRIDLRGSLRSILPTDLDNPGPMDPRRIEARRGRGDPPGTFAHDCAPDSGIKKRSEADCPRPPGWLRWVGRGAVLAYLAGLSTGLGLLSLGVWGSSLLIRRSSLPSAGASAIYSSMADRTVQGRPRLLVSRRAGRPVLLGIVRPAILIPPELDQPDMAERLRLSLLHELAHAESSDHLFGLVANLAQAIWFFLPPVWWIRDQMKLDQEFLADRRAVDHFGTSGHYASSLVELASSRVSVLQGTASIGHEPESAGVASALFQRILMLLKCPFAVEGRTPLWWRWWAASTLGLATLAASCLTLRGFAGWSTPGPATPVEAPRSFKLPQLVIGQRENDDQPFDLRFRLPEQFSLTLEILAEPTDLPALEVLGHKLGPACDHEPASGAYRLWHQVRIRRSAGTEDLEVDGRPVADPSRPPKLSTWLSIRALPGRTTRIRDLEMSW